MGRNCPGQVGSYIDVLLLSILENQGVSSLGWCLLHWITSSKEGTG